MEVMSQWEDDLRKAFGRQVAEVRRYENNVRILHKALENYTGEKWTPPEKPLKEKIVDVLKFADDGSEWNSATMQKHLFFFHKKNYDRGYIATTLKRIASTGLLTKVGRGVYRKQG